MINLVRYYFFDDALLKFVIKGKTIYFGKYVIPQPV